VVQKQDIQSTEMSMNIMTTHAVVGDDVVLSSARQSAIFNRLSGFVANRIARFRAMRARRRTLAALRGLDDRMLKDIGLSRSELLSISYGRPSDKSLN
jgi:uncharacterized protein YjiS (DUF1127 family)